MARRTVHGSVKAIGNIAGEESQETRSLKDAGHRELIEKLTEGWDGWHIERALADEERANLAALLSMGRIALPDDKPR